MCATKAANSRIAAFALALTAALVFTSPALALSANAHAMTEAVYKNVYPVADNENWFYPQISGLDDPEVESAVNARISDLYYERCEAEPPAYRGIKLLERIKTKDEDQVYVVVQGCVDNLLCAQAVREMWYYDRREDKKVLVSDTRAVTLDLATGREVKFGELFKDGADWKGYVNGVVSEYIMRRGIADECDPQAGDDYDYLESSQVYPPRFNLTAPFTGVSEDSAFTLENFNCSVWLTLLIDERTPEFQTDYKWRSINVPICDFMDFNEKFLPAIESYEGRSLEWFLCEPESGSIPVTTFTQVFHPLGDDCLVSVETEAVLGSDWTGALREAVTEFALDCNLSDEAVAAYREDRAKSGTLSFTSATEANYYCVGDYINVMCRCELRSESDRAPYTEIKSLRQRAAFNANTGEKADADAIFADANWQTALAEAILLKFDGMRDEYLEEIAPGFGPVRSDSRWAEAARAMAQNVSGFSVNVQSLSIDFGPELSRMLPNGMDDMEFRSWVNIVEYSDIGYERLRLFD